MSVLLFSLLFRISTQKLRFFRKKGDSALGEDRTSLSEMLQSRCIRLSFGFSLSRENGVLLAAGGIIWCGVDLYKAKAELPLELTAILQRTILDYQEACRREALK